MEADKRRLSASQCNLFNKCKFQWKLKYYDAIPPDNNFTYAATIFGTALHHTFEMIYGDFDHVSVDMDKEELSIKAMHIFKDKFKEEYDKNIDEGIRVILSKSYDSTLASYSVSVKSAIKKFITLDLFSKYEKILCEDEFHYEDEDFRLIALLDFVCFYPDGSYDVIDLKTGKHFSVDDVMDDYQAIIYSKIAYDKFGSFPKQFKFLKFNVNRIAFSIVGGDVKPSVVIDKFETELKKFKQSILTNNFPKLDTTQNEEFCGWCQWRKTCKKLK